MLFNDLLAYNARFRSLGHFRSLFENKRPLCYRVLLKQTDVNINNQMFVFFFSIKHQRDTTIAEN